MEKSRTDHLKKPPKSVGIDAEKIIPYAHDIFTHAVSKSFNPEPTARLGLSGPRPRRWLGVKQASVRIEQRHEH